MAHQKDSLLSFLGTIAFGDFAGMTTYRDQRGHVVWFTKTWPEKPASPRQAADRLAFTAAVQAWHGMTTAQRAAWTKAARTGSLCCSGFNLWIHHVLKHHTPWPATLARRARVTLWCPLETRNL